ncbi:MAG: hypothetical protein QOE45_2498 [Frankiaceae bacterium]|jgi:hypothetical protein|nr:hypothetical protein [Frankiaceae bacterium]
MGYNVQSSTPDATVKVFGGNLSGATGLPQTDIIISEPGFPGHRHIVFDVNGNQVFDQIRPNH